MTFLRRFRQPLVSTILAAALLVGITGVAVPATGDRAVDPVLRQDPVVKVWVNTSSGVYHCPGGRYYGTTKTGSYLPESDARQKGYRPAYGKTCGPLAAPSDSLAKRPLATAAPLAESAVKVWVNTASGVYHCPGTRYYGSTKAGKYLTEAAARAAGNRPAYGRSCT